MRITSANEMRAEYKRSTRKQRTLRPFGEMVKELYAANEPLRLVYSLAEDVKRTDMKIYSLFDEEVKIKELHFPQGPRLKK